MQALGSLEMVMIRSVLIASAALFALVSTAAANSPTPASGPMCGDRGAVVALLKQQYSEVQEETNLQSDQALMELFASERGTWSILMTSPAGTTCIVATGKGLHTLARV